MIGSGLIVFRESLEAALLVGIMAAATKGVLHRVWWLTGGVVAGIMGSCLVAGLMSVIAGLASGRGQEIFNAIILGLAIIMIGWHNIWMANHSKQLVNDAKSLSWEVKNGTRELSAVALAIAMIVLREGSESVLFLQGLMASESMGQVLSGGVLGLMGGVLLGLFIYKGLIQIPLKSLFSVTSMLLMVVAAGLAGQLAKFLIQADLIPSIEGQIWDTTNILSVDSYIGNGMHILLGYEPTPSAMQVIFYFGTMIVISGLSWRVKKGFKKQVNNSIMMSSGVQV
jgi:high-affinity iron transporter